MCVDASVQAKRTSNIVCSDILYANINQKAGLAKLETLSEWTSRQAENIIHTAQLYGTQYERVLLIP